MIIVMIVATYSKPISYPQMHNPFLKVEYDWKSLICWGWWKCTLGCWRRTPPSWSWPPPRNTSWPTARRCPPGKAWCLPRTSWSTYQSIMNMKWQKCISLKCMEWKKTSLKLENLKTMVQFDRYFGWYESDRVDSMIIRCYIVDCKHDAQQWNIEPNFDFYTLTSSC